MLILSLYFLWLTLVLKKKISFFQVKQQVKSRTKAYFTVLTNHPFFSFNPNNTQINNPPMKKIVLGSIVILSSLQSCVVVEEYEKVYINDPDMVLTARSSERFENAFQVYREAAVGGNGGKTGGGCGCN